MVGNAEMTNIATSAARDVPIATQMQEKHTRVRGEAAIWHELATKGSPLHFCHGNGYPTGTYRQFLTPLAQSYRILALALRATWPGIGPPPRRFRWKDYGDDLVDFLSRQANRPVIGLGHSLGATVTLFAAAQRPELFRALVLIEPSGVSRWLGGLDYVVPHAIRGFFEPVRSTLTKADQWPSRDAFMEELRQHRGYRRCSASVLRDLADFALFDATSQGQRTRDAPSGKYVRRVFPTVWEAHNYSRPTYINGVVRRLAVDLPVLVVRAKPSIFLPDRVWQRWRDDRPDHWFQTFADNGHLLPLEAPEDSAHAILAWLAERGLSRSSIG